MTLERRIEALEGQAGAGQDTMPYLSFDWDEVEAANEAAREFVGKVYVGVSPDDWPGGGDDAQA